MDFDRNRADLVNDPVNHDRCHLTDAGCKCRTLNSKTRERSDSENNQRIQNDVDNTADHHTGHRHFHPADCLKNLFKVKVCHDCYGKQKDNP